MNAWKSSFSCKAQEYNQVEWYCQCIPTKSTNCKYCFEKVHGKAICKLARTWAWFRNKIMKDREK